MVWLARQGAHENKAEKGNMRFATGGEKICKKQLWSAEPSGSEEKNYILQYDTKPTVGYLAAIKVMKKQLWVFWPRYHVSKMHPLEAPFKTGHSGAARKPSRV